MMKTPCISLLLICQLAISILVQAQSANGINELSGRLNSYLQNRVDEKIFLQPDKTVYLAGETCWFSVYCLSASDHRPLGASRVAYVEVLNRSGQPVMQTKVRLDSGFASGTIPLSPSLSTGHYLLRAYTAWMQNNSSNFFYSQDITVINTLRGTAADLRDSTRRPVLAFFPEGGGLVAGIPSRLACRAGDGAGMPLYTRVEIRNGQHERIVAANTDSNGIVVFELTPRAGDSLYGFIAADSNRLFALAPIQANGYVLRVEENEGRDLAVAVRASSREENKTIYAAAHTRQVLRNLQSARITGSAALFHIPTDSLGDGISVITLFDENRQPVAERLFFNSPKHQLSVTASTDQPDYSQRSAVRLSIKTSAEGTPVAARLSASVFKIDTLQQVPRENIVNWLLLRSDLPELLPEVGRYVGLNDLASRVALDKIMLTSGWRRFSWSESDTRKSPVFHFLPEMEGPVVYARAVNRTTGLAVAGVPYLMTVPGRSPWLTSSTSNAHGDLRFPSRPFGQGDPVIIQPSHAADSNYRLDVRHAFSDSSTQYVLPSIRLDRGLSDDLTSRHVALQVESSFRREKDLSEISTPAVDSVGFYGIPDRRFRLSNYTRYVTMEEVLREFVDDVRLRKDGKQYHFFVRNTLFNTFFENEPLILLDGVPVSDPSKIIALDPLKISDIDIVTHRFSRGSTDFDGIITIRSVSGEAGVATLDPGAVILDYAGLQERRKFYSPDYGDSTKALSSIPDFRTTLWWSPDLRTGRTGSLEAGFFSGDIPGRYALLVEGITAGGQAGYQVQIFNVAEKPEK